MNPGCSRRWLYVWVVLLVSACGGGSESSDPDPVPDTQGPVASAITPMVGETGVDVSSKIILAFNESVTPSSLGADAFQIFLGTTVVASSYTHDTVNNLLLLTPDANLLHDTEYTARAKGSITDLAGNALGTDYSWTFTTRSDRTFPQLINISPAEDELDVALDVVVTAQFDEPMDPASLAGFGISGVAGTASVAGDGSLVEFVPDAPLDNLTVYQVELPSTLTDLAGNPLAMAKTWSFTTLPDLIPPVVTQTTPAEGAVVPIGTFLVSIEFSEPLEPASVNSGIVVATEGGLPFTINTLNLSPSNQINLFLPALSFDTEYTFTLSGPTDTAGNSLAQPFTLTFRTEPDTFPPTITGKSPGPDGRLVPPDAILQVTFSEAMESGLIDSTTLGIQGVSGIVTYDALANRATFTPNAPLTPGQTYTAMVSGSLTDTAGNSLGADQSWSFQVLGAPIQISDDSTAGHGPARVAFGGTDGFAVWSVTSGNGVKLVAARRNTSATTFGTEQTLVEYPGDTTQLQPAIASNGSSFAVVWVRPRTGQIFASLFTGGTWSTPQLLGSGDGGPGRLGIVSNGSGYAAGWNDLFTYFAAVHDGVDWAVTTLGATSTGGSGPVGPLKLVSDGTGYAMSWVGRFSVFSGGSWSTINTDGSNTDIVAGSTGYAATWRQIATSFPGRDWIFARVHNGTGWSAPVQLTNFVDIGMDTAVASNGGSYAIVTTSRVDITTGDRNLDLYQFNGTDWIQTNLKTVPWNGQFMSDPQIASNGTGYAVTWREASALLARVDLGLETTLFASGVTESLLVAGGNNYFVVQNDSVGRIRARVFVTSWLAETFLSNADSQAQSMEVVPNGSGVLVGYGTDTADARLATYSTFTIGTGTGTVSAIRLLVSGIHLGGVRNAVAAVNGLGDTMLVWEQFDSGVWQVRGRSLTNGIPGPVRIISANGQFPDVAGDGSSFMVAWLSNQEVFASRYTPATNTLSTATLLGTATSSSGPSIAAIGSTFLVGWDDARNVQVAEFDGTWGATVALFTSTSNFQDEVLVTGNGTDYAIVWLEDLFTGNRLNAMVRTAGIWSARVTLESASSGVAQVSLLSDGAGYAAIYRAGSIVKARVYESGVWDLATSLASANSQFSASKAGEYRALMGFSTFDERVYSAGAWGAVNDVNLRPRAFASDGNGYALLGSTLTAGDSQLFSQTWGAEGWSGTVPVVGVLGGNIDRVLLHGRAGLYVPAWSQPAIVEPIAQRLWTLPNP